MNHLLDEELIKLVLSGENEAFAVLVQRYEKQVFSLAYRLCANYDEAADLAQEAFIQVYSVLVKYEIDRPFFPWLYRVAYNTCINVLRKKPPNITNLEDFTAVLSQPEDDTIPEVSYDRQETKAFIEKSIADLPEKYKEPVILRYLENLSYQQIADRMDVPVSTIETRLYRGRLLLQEKLGKYTGKRKIK